MPVYHRLEACATGKNLTFMLLASCLLFAVLTGCKKEEAPAPAEAAPTKMAAAAPVQVPLTTEKKIEYVYNPIDKRDPFKPFIQFEKKATISAKVPLTPLQAYDINELRLVGVLMLPDKKVAMIEDPMGKGYNVKVGTLMGKNEGKVVEIRKDEVVIEESYIDEMARTITRKVSIKISREEGGEK